MTEATVINPEIHDIYNRFSAHACDQGVISAIRTLFLNHACELNKLVPSGREKALVMTKLEEAMFFANAGVARNSSNKDAQK